MRCHTVIKCIDNVSVIGTIIERFIVMLIIPNGSPEAIAQILALPFHDLDAIL